jgi:hypothetical protein
VDAFAESIGLAAFDPILLLTAALLGGRRSGARGALPLRGDFRWAEGRIVSVRGRHVALGKARHGVCDDRHGGRVHYSLLHVHEFLGCQRLFEVYVKLDASFPGYGAEAQVRDIKVNDTSECLDKVILQLGHVHDRVVVHIEHDDREGARDRGWVGRGAARRSTRGKRCGCVGRAREGWADRRDRGWTLRRRGRGGMLGTIAVCKAEGISLNIGDLFTLQQQAKVRFRALGGYQVVSVHDILG